MNSDLGNFKLVIPVFITPLFISSRCQPSLNERLLPCGFIFFWLTPLLPSNAAQMSGGWAELPTLSDVVVFPDVLSRRPGSPSCVWGGSEQDCSFWCLLQVAGWAVLSGSAEGGTRLPREDGKSTASTARTGKNYISLLSSSSYLLEKKYGLALHIFLFSIDHFLSSPSVAALATSAVSGSHSEFSLPFSVSSRSRV